MMAMAGASVCGIDYSPEAIETANDRYPEIEIHCADYREQTEALKSDRLVLMGVLEHLDKPWEELKWMVDNLLTPGGDIVISAPNFTNPRGFVWMALQELLDVPMSLTDLHQLSLWDFNQFCADTGYRMMNRWSIEHSWAGGQKMLDDFQKRLPAALKEANLPTAGVYKFLRWLEKYTETYTWVAGDGQGCGAVAIYRIQT